MRASTYILVPALSLVNMGVNAAAISNILAARSDTIADRSGSYNFRAMKTQSARQFHTADFSAGAVPDEAITNEDTTLSDADALALAGRSTLDLPTSEADTDGSTDALSWETHPLDEAKAYQLRALTLTQTDGPALTDTIGAERREEGHAIELSRDEINATDALKPTTFDRDGKKVEAISSLSDKKLEQRELPLNLTPSFIEARTIANKVKGRDGLSLSEDDAPAAMGIGALD